MHNAQGSSLRHSLLGLALLSAACATVPAPVPEPPVVTWEEKLGWIMRLEDQRLVRDPNSPPPVVLVPATRKYLNLHVYTADGIWFLNRFEREIDLLYLDAWDVIAGSNYAEKHLEAYRAALPHLARTCVVLIDDTDILNGGKGRLVIPQMIRDGFDLVTWGRQALLVRS